VYNVNLERRLMEDVNYRFWIASSCLDNVDSLFHDSSRISTVIWRVDSRQQGDIHSKRLRGHSPTLPDPANVRIDGTQESYSRLRSSGVG